MRLWALKPASVRVQAAQELTPGGSTEGINSENWLQPSSKSGQAQEASWRLAWSMPTSVLPDAEQILLDHQEQKD